MMLVYHAEALVKVLATLLLIQLSVNVLGKAADDGPSTWTPISYGRDQEGAPGFCLLLSV